MKIALIGNPNSGKTTLFNRLTGAKAHTGNWPGVTVAKRTGAIKKNSETLEIIDLPGIYGLNASSPEELITRDFLLSEIPDVVVNIVDASNLERNLFLTSQLLELNTKMLIVLNMMDVVDKNGQKIDIEKLESTFGVKIITISAIKSKSITVVIDEILKVQSTLRKPFSILNDEEFKKHFSDISIDNTYDNSLFVAIRDLEEKHDITMERYKRIRGFVESKNTLNNSDKIDRIITNKWLGLPIFMSIMFVVFHLTFSENFLFLGFFLKGHIDSNIFGVDALNSPGVILLNLVDTFLSFCIDKVFLSLASSPAWVQGLLVDGVLTGVFSVLSFMPQILCLFFFIGILEDSGYMARTAFIMDRIFRKIGLSGKTFMPLLMCFGCAVPGVMATRTLETPREKRIAIMLAPFFSCGAKLPIWAVFAYVLFGGAYGDLVVGSIYFLGIFVAILGALIMKFFSKKGDIAQLVIELPAYHFPVARNIAINLLEKLKHYVFRAGTIIAGSIVIIWVLTNFSFTFELVSIEDSILGNISKFVTILFIPLGFGGIENGYMFIIASSMGLVAKEMVPAILSSFAQLKYSGALDPLALLIDNLGVAASFSFMAFNLLVVPCIATVAAAKGELKNQKHFILAILFWVATAYVIGTLIYYCLTYYIFGIVLISLIMALISVILVIDRRNAICKR